MIAYHGDVDARIVDAGLLRLLLQDQVCGKRRQHAQSSNSLGAATRAAAGTETRAILTASAPIIAWSVSCSCTPSAVAISCRTYEEGFYLRINTQLGIFT